MSQNQGLIESSLTNIVKILKKQPIKKLNEKLRVDDWHPASQLFVDLGLLGLILLILTFFILPWYIMWFYVFFLVFISGFIFTRPGKKFNFTLILVVLTILAFIPSSWGQYSLSTVSLNIKEDVKDETWGVWGWDGNWADADVVQGEDEEEGATGEADPSDLYEKIRDLERNPFDDLIGYTEDFMDVVNWIFFFFIVAYGLSAIGDALTFQYDKIAKKIGYIALAITIMTFVHGIFLTGGIEIRTVWDTMGSAWDNLMKGIGFAQLSQSGNTYITPKTAVNGIFAWIPFFSILFCFSMGIYWRKRDLPSIMFVRHLTEEDTIQVSRTNFSKSVLLLIIIFVIFITGYFLITADPEVVIDPIITLAYYIGSGIILFLLGFRILILNKSQKVGPFIKNTIKWTFLGLMGLFLWFSVFQPAMYALNFLDYPSGILFMNQSSSSDPDVLNNQILTQLFLVAFPETLIFQIGIMGAVNRVYFALRKGSLIEKEEARLEEKKDKLIERKERISIREGSTSRANLRNLVKVAVIQKEIDKIDQKLDEAKTTKLPYSYFVIVSLISGLFGGGFLFSDYHRFRRGISFQAWWQNPMLGLTYMGAGFMLSLIAFFSWPAAILVHWLNNVIAMILGGG